MKKTLAFTLGTLLLIALTVSPAMAKKRHKKHHHKKHAQSQTADDEKKS